MTEMIHLLIVDDHPIVRKGLHMLINSEPGMQVAGEASDGREAVTKARELKPDVILMDLLMPQMDGVQAIQAIKKADPSARILVLSSFAEDDQIFPAIKAGASGYLLKDSQPEELLASIRQVYQRRPALHPTIAARLMKELNIRDETPATGEVLTEREVDVLRWIAQGLANSEIAARLVISERTVSSHISNILDKLHLANRTQAALYALREGLASLYPPAGEESP